MLAYGIRGSATITYWLKKYGRSDLLAKRVRIEIVEEKDQLKEARKRISARLSLTRRAPLFT